jgi:hypothetical protein
VEFVPEMTSGLGRVFSSRDLSYRKIFCHKRYEGQREMKAGRGFRPRKYFYRKKLEAKKEFLLE